MQRGRPSHKPGYDPEELMKELMDTVLEVYREKREIKETSIELDMLPNKVKKLLITDKVLTYLETAGIQELLKSGRSMIEVQEILGLS